MKPSKPTKRRDRGDVRSVVVAARFTPKEWEKEVVPMMKRLKVKTPGDIVRRCVLSFSTMTTKDGVNP